MPIPRPSPNESRKKFMSRCIPVMIAEGRLANIAGGICATQWSNRNKQELEKSILSVDIKKESILS